VKITVNGVEYASTADALLAARAIEDAVRKAQAASKPTFTLITESTHYLWCSWCEKYVMTFQDKREQQQAEWEHLAADHPGTERI